MRNSKYKFQVLYLYISTILGSILGFVTSILNTNFLSDAEYGDVRYVQNLISLYASLLLFGYFLSGSRLLAVSKNQNYSSRVRGAMVVVLVICSIILVFATFVSALLHRGSEMMSLLLISMPVCMYPLFTNYINTTAQGDNHIGRLAFSRVMPALLYIPIAYLVYSKTTVTSSLMMILQWGVYCVVLLVVILSTRPAFNNLKPVFSDLKVENNTYGKHLYYGSLLMVATNYLAGVTLGVFNDDNVNVAYYTLALTLTAPLAYLPGIIGTAYFKKFVDEPRIPSNVMRGSLIITILSCLFFIVLIKYVVEVFYPESYLPVGSYASWMAVGFSVHGIGDMINRFLGSHGEGISIRNSSYACGICKIIGFVFLVWIWDINGALLTNILSSFVYCITLLCYYVKYIK